MASHVQLHPVAAFYLKGDVIAGGSGVVGHAVGAVMVVGMGYIGAFGHHCGGDGEPGGMIVLVPLADAFDGDNIQP